MPEPGGPLRMRKVIFHCTVLSSALLGAIGIAVAAEAATLSLLPHGPEMPVIKVLGCRIHGLGIVCSPGVVLPKRPRKERYHQEEAEPSYKGQSGKTPSAKGGSASSKESSPATNGSQKDTLEQPEGAGSHACPPGNVVLEKPDAKGSYCEQVAGQSSGAQAGQSGDAASQMDKPSVTGTAGSTNSHSQTGAAAGSAESSANGGGGAPSGVNPEVAAPAAAATGSSGVCCSAQVVDKASATSTPAGGSIRSCRQNETDARNAVGPTADTSNFSLAGPISCDTK